MDCTLRWEIKGPLYTVEIYIPSSCTHKKVCLIPGLVLEDLGMRLQEGTIALVLLTAQICIVQSPSPNTADRKAWFVDPCTYTSLLPLLSLIPKAREPAWE